MTKDESRQMYLLGMFTGAFVVAFLWFASSFRTVTPATPQAVSPEVYQNGTGTSVLVRGDRWGLMVGDWDAILDLEGMYGLTDCKNKKIHIRSSLGFENQRDTVIHELLHAGTCDTTGEPHNKFYNSESEEGHEGFYKISAYITSVLHDNPELAAYLAH